MKPIAIVIGDHAIHYYGLMFALAMVAAVVAIRHELGRLGRPRDWSYDLVLGSTVSGVLGAKLLYVLVQIARGLGPRDWGVFARDGLVIFGGIFALVLFVYLYARWRGESPWLMLDITIPGAVLAHAFGRVGCFMQGCCWGRECQLPWAVTFTDPASSAPIGVPLHPTQLYDSLSSLTLFAIMWSWRKRKRFDGHIIVIFLGLYGPFRAFVELFRGDTDRGVFMGVSTSQWLAVVSVALSLWFWRLRSRSGESPTLGPPGRSDRSVADSARAGRGRA